MCNVHNLYQLLDIFIFHCRIIIPIVDQLQLMLVFYAWFVLLIFQMIQMCLFTPIKVVLQRLRVLMTPMISPMLEMHWHSWV